MTILESLLRPAPERRGIQDPAVPLTSSTLLDWMAGPKVHAGVAVSEKTSLGMSAVWRSVNLIAGTSASLPLHAYRSEDDIRVRASRDQHGAKLLANPHPDLTPMELWEIVFAHLLLWGNAYLQMLRNPLGQVTELWPIHPSLVRPGRAKDMTKVYVVSDNFDDPRTDDSILHIPGFGYDGVVGLSPIKLARQGIGLALAAEEYGAKLFGSGSLASGILTTDNRLTEEQATSLKDRWKAKVTGLNRAHDIAVLDSGAKFQQLTIPPDDAQFIESRRFQISEIARWYGVPAHMLADTERSTSWGTGIESMTLGFVKFTLRPYLTRVEQRVTRVISPGTVYARYSLEGLLRGDSEQRSKFYKALWELGVLSTNDIRRLEDLAPVTGGDVRYRPLNFGVLGQADPAADPADPTSQEVPA